MQKIFFKTLTIISVCVFAGFGCTSDEGGGFRGFLSKAFQKGGSGVPVTVEKPILEESSVTITVPGIVTPSERVEISLPNDVRIDTFFVNVGERVSSGTPLFQISREDLNLKLAQLRAERDELQTNLERNNYFFRNRDRLLEEGRITTEQYDSLEGEVEKNEEELERVRQEISNFENQAGGPTVINSSINGVVQSKLNSAGGVAVANTPIVTIVKNNPMMVNFNLASYAAKTVAPGQSIAVKLVDLPGEDFDATIESIGTEIDRDTKTFEVKAALLNPQGIIKAGMNAFVEFKGAEKQKFFVIPAEAVITDRRRHYVFTVVKGTAHKVRVIPKEIRGSIAEIVEGLHANDLVVVKGNKNLSEGTIVDIW